MNKAFQRIVTNPFKFRLFLFTQLPAAFFAGIKPIYLDESSSAILVKEKWFNKNPFKSIYFAILAMAAELSTGVLCMGCIYNKRPVVSMLVVKQEGIFYKKSTGKIIFKCNDGKRIMEAIEESITSGEGSSIICNSKGFDENHILVAEFNFTWSFKAKGK